MASLPSKGSRRKKLSVVHRVVIIGGALIVIEGFYLWLMSGNESHSTMEALERELSKDATSTPRINDLRRLQSALRTYRSSKGGELPKTLNDLVPSVLQSIPVDPNTGKQFAYEIVNGTPYVGEEEIVQVKTGVIAKAGPGQGNIKAVEVSDDPTKMTAEQAKALIASLDQKDVNEEYVYDPSNKRDPFRPFDFSPRIVGLGSGTTDLEKVDTSTLRLVAILDGFDEKIAMVESTTGQGFTLRKSTKVGVFGGEVISIDDECAIIVETVEEFTGEKTTREVKLCLHDTGEKEN